MCLPGRTIGGTNSLVIWNPSLESRVGIEFLLNSFCVATQNPFAEMGFDPVSIDHKVAGGDNCVLGCMINHLL